MKKPTFSKFVIFTSLFLMNLTLFAQNDKAFGVRFDKDVQGDMLLIGNNILSQDNNNYNNDGEYNSNIDMKYVDVDSDPTTFSSSSAKLDIPNKGCAKVLYAGLYWSAILQDGDRSTINSVKFKTPTGGYNNITGQIIWDADAKPVASNKPYVCYADVTNLMDAMNPNGEYTVANVVAGLGFNGGTGMSAGWSLYIVYEDLTLTSKSITSFDGFSGITRNTGTLDIPITGFRTIPTGPVRAKIAFAALEGDKPIPGDYLQINGSAMSTTERPADNFFNSTVTDLNGLYTNRTPASSNTLGYDAGIMKVNNPATKKYPGGSVIKNDDTSATITLGSTQDTYFFYFTAFAVDIIAPKIVLTKIVQDNSGKDIGNTNVTLGDQLNYVIGFQNVGNDDAKSLTIRDVLPINIIFNYPADLTALPTGVTVKSYNAATREIIFDIDKSVVEVGDAALEIRFKVKVVPSCNMLSDACSNSIDNTAYATYKGTLNPDFILTDDPSANTNTGCLLVKKATNFLVGIDDCKFTKNEILCGATVTLKAANGYNSYSWSSSPTGTPVLGTGQTLTVSKVGTYYVHDTAVAPCLSIDETVTVTSFGGIVNNPVIPFADQVVVCTSDGKKLPNIFLCGANASKLIQTNISDGSTIVWEKLNENGTCPAATSTTLCANESASCSWTQVATGPDYLANTSGQFRLTLTYPGGCFNRFYFNVFQNLLNPTATSTDIYCNTPAKITIGGVGAGYEYSLDGVTYQSSNVFPNASFPVVTAGLHTVYIRQTGVTNGCVFEVKNIQILDKVLKVNTTKVVQPLCFGSKGSIKVGANDVKGQYTYTLYKNGVFVSTSGLTNALDYEFLNLDGGTTTPLAPIQYRIDVTTDNGCSDSVTVDLIMPDPVTASAALTKPFTCNDGEITVNAAGGTKPYFYFVNSSTVFQTVPQIVVTNPLPAGGVYNIDVVDDNGCKAQTSITVNNIPKPVYTVTKTDVKCYGDNTGSIQFNVTNANGYTLMYSIDGGVTYSASNVFSNLVAGTVYTPQIKYSLGGVDCIDSKPTITLTEPAAQLTASAGVSELAGCGDGVIVPKNNGKIRITNVQGGTPTYEYSFDNQVSWIGTNEAYKAPGTYTVYVRDSNKCIFSASVTIDPEPVAPVIDVATPVDFNCDGTATSTVIVNNPGTASFTYKYYLDGVLNPNTPANKFLNVLPGTHAIRVEYSVNSVPTYSNLLKETFGSGNPTLSPGIASAYCFNDQRVNAPYLCGTRSIEDNQYSVANDFWRGDDPSGTNVGAWYHFKDHTSNGTDPKGRFLIVNIGGAAGANGILYSKVINDIIPNQPVIVEAYLSNLLRLGFNGGADPSFSFELVDSTGKVVAQQPPIPPTPNPTGIPAIPTIPRSNNWELRTVSLNPGFNTTLTFNVRSGSTDYSGNDAVIDDITVYQLPKACATIKDYTIVVPTGKAFSAAITGHKDVTCNNLKDGEITISAQNFDTVKGFQYSLDNGTTWNTSLTSPKVITGLDSGTYSISIRPDATSSAACTKPFTQEIKKPAAIMTVVTVPVLATCTTGATIETNASGGTAAYQYELRKADGITVVAPYQASNQFTNVPVGSYTVFVKDANLCVNPVGATVDVLAPPTLTATLDTGTDLCYDTVNKATFVVKVTGGVGPFTYKLDTNAAQNSNTFNNVGPGLHTILVTDATTNCTANVISVTIEPELKLTATLGQDLTCLVDASMTTTIVGGNGAPYTYTVSHNGGAPTTVASFPYMVSVSGTYVFTVTDSKGCSATSNTITVTPKTTPTLLFKSTDITCNNANDGTITVTASNGFTSSYTYAIKLNSAAAYTTQTTNKFTGLAAGTYNIKVIDSKGCESAVTDVTIVNPAIVGVSAVVTTPFSCSATNTKVAAVITVTGSGGSGTFTYSFNNGTSYSSANTLTVNDNGSIQSFDIIVKDNKGCLSSVQHIDLAPLNPPTDLTFANAAVTCTAPTTKVTLTATNGVAALQYETIAPSVVILPKQSSNEFPGLAPGNYTFRVTDANGCYYTESYIVKAVTPITASATKLKDIDCFGNTTGSIRYNVGGFTTYSYSVNGGTAVTGQTAATFTLPNLGAATYNVVFTDETTGCTASTSTTITQPTAALAATYVTINANCNVATSKVTVNVTPGTGTPGYTYSFNNSNVTAGTYVASNVANLSPALTWYAWVKDANGCTVTLPLTLVKDSAPTAVTATATGQCLGVGSYTITATVTGGTGALLYSIDNGASWQSGNTFVVTAAGTYTIRVKDANGCTKDSNPITVASQLTLTAVLNKGITCNPAPTAAQITLTPTGGVGAFSYESKEALGAYTAMGSNVFTSATAGSYTFRVTDATTGCTALTTTPIVTTTPINPDITGVTQTAFINCNTDRTAAISIAIDNTKGQAPFVFNVKQYSDLAHTILVNDFGTQTSGLPAGFYVVTVTDAKGCMDTEPITIAEPTPMVIDKTVIPIQCNGSGISKGSIIINKITDGVSPLGGTGGTAPYTYYVTGINGYNQSEPNASGTTSVTFNVVDFGLYQIRVVDAKGCTVIEKDVLVASPPNSLGITINPTVTCATGGSAIVKITSAFAGTGPFHFNIYNGPGQVWTADGTDGWQGEMPAGSKETLFSPLLPGVTYTFIVYDENTKCYYYETAAIPVPSITSLSANNIVPKNITCKGSNDGNVSFDITNASGASLDYTYEVFEAFTNISKYVSGTSTIPGSSTINIPNIPITLGVGSYYVYIKEMSGPNSGCGKASANFNINESPTVLTVTATKTKNVNCNEDGIIAAQPQGGTAPYTYQYLLATDPVPTASTGGWTGNTTFATSVTGNYIVYVKDAYGCIKQDAVTLVADALPTISAPSSICYDGATAFTINLSLVSSATILPATYSVNGSAFQTSPNFTFNASGTYNLVIKDGNGCTANVDYVVYPKLDLSATLTKELDCTGTPDAIITLTTTGGNTTPTANYTYEVSFNGGGFAVVTSPYTATTAGTYDFRVTDANNTTLCQATKKFILDPIPTTVFTTTQTHVSCNGDSDGTITVNVTAGEGPYEYSLTDGVTTTPFQTGNSFTGLKAGTTYVVSVRNVRNCVRNSAAITITEPNPLLATSAITTPLTCGAGNVAQPATVTVTATPGTGTAPYQYSFDGGTSYSSTNTYQTYVGITFNVLVKDAKGCIYTLVNGVNIPALDPPTQMDIAGTPIYCVAPNTTSTVTISNVINGVGPFTYQIISPAIVNNGNNPIFAGLTPNTYTFQVTDANNCTYQEAYTVDPVNNITVAGRIISNVTCFNAANGVAQFDITNFTGNYNYLFDGVPVNGVNNAQLTFTNLAPGVHTLDVTDAITGCQNTASVTISQPAAALDFTATATNTNCNNDNATITVTPTGGTAPYKYAAVIAGSPAPTVFSTSNLITVDTNTGANMTWDVYVTDANGCPINKPQTILLDASPSLISVAPYSECPNAITGTYTFTVNVPTGVGPFEYSIGGGFQTSPTFVVNAPGNYNVTVKDKNGCTTTATALVTIRQPLILTPVVTTPPSCSDNDGVISVSTTGGSGSYVYNIDGGAFVAVTSFSSVIPGTHTIGVKDTATLCEVYVPITLSTATRITGFGLTQTAVTCNGGNDGTITATMATPAPGVNDNPVYRYTLSGTTVTGTAVNVGPQDFPLFSGLKAGNYTVDVISGRNCPASLSITVGQPDPIDVPAPAVVQFACTSGNTGNFATITVNGVTGGSGTYTIYEFIKGATVVQRGASNVYIISDLSGGNYTVNVYDNKRCIGSIATPITIAPFIALDKINVAITKAITCNNLEDIKVTVNATGGTPTNLEYTLVDVNATTGVNGGLYPSQTNATGIFTGLPVANYLITVKNLDTGCTMQAAHYVNEPNTFDLLIDNIVDVTCFTYKNGSANVTFIDRVITATDPNQAGAFTYTLVDALGNALPGGTSSNAGPVTISNLGSGTYTVTATLTNSPFCTFSKNFTISGPAAALDVSKTSYTRITCASNNDGTISATAVGGWPGGYMYQLELVGGTVISRWSTVSEFSRLGAGNYIVKVKDSKGCEDTVSVTLSIPTPIAFTATPSTTLLTCFGDTNASITVSAPTGGQGSNYLYTLNTTSVTPNTFSGPQASPVFANLGAGTYTVTVTDGFSCSKTSAPVVIAQPSIVKASLVVSSTQTCTVLTSLTLSATGGTGLYSYSTTPNFAVTLGTFASSVTFTVPTGTHRYYVKDANGCISIVSNDVTIDPLVPLTIKLDVTNAVVNCRGDKTGVIVATANGGLGNYVYTLLDDATNTPIAGAVQTSPGYFTQLASGTYKVRVVSRDCNTTTATITIKEPNLPLIAPFTATPVTCNGNGDGKVVINASGGTGIIKYAISPNLDQFFESNTFNKLKPNNYDVIVQDVLGCYVRLNFTITEPNPIDVSTVANSIIPEVCVGDKNGAFKINVTGGVAPYNVELDKPSTANTQKGTATQTQFDFTNGITGGDHMVYVTDMNGCTAEWKVSLPKAINLDPKAVVTYECDVNTPGNKVTVTVDPSNTVPSEIDYIIDGVKPFQASNVFANVAPGLHYVEARHTNGCIQKFSGIAVEKIDPLSLSIDLGGLNEIVATVSGGSGIYQLTVNGEPMTAQNKFIYFKSGDYTVVLTDSNGCTVSATKHFDFIDIIIPPIFTPTGDNTNDTWKPTNTENYPDIKFIVYDRYGREVGVFGAGESWDGKYNGTELPMGDYWYVLKLRHSQDDREFIGHFTLYR
ncbi:T9SS type B sorting domain-containing protein [Flavobacterium aestivum]|uniref:T9SS type B sorting domain-containing protein n=1 Tax=Flavobacterium aestivum TaxID=3003257 RepID=UPI002482C0E4|nr:T9SS type B sorting domain-containing protein [Flavobacterium aestivum]